jgi:hypothetical protein
MVGATLIVLDIQVELRRLCLEALRLQIWSVEKLHDQQYPFAQMENPLTTTDGHRFANGIHHTSWLPEGSGPCSMRYKSVLW